MRIKWDEQKCLRYVGFISITQLSKNNLVIKHRRSDFCRKIWNSETIQWDHCVLFPKAFLDAALCRSQRCHFFAELTYLKSPTTSLIKLNSEDSRSLRHRRFLLCQFEIYSEKAFWWANARSQFFRALSANSARSERDEEKFNYILIMKMISSLKALLTDLL